MRNSQCFILLFNICIACHIRLVNITFIQDYIGECESNNTEDVILYFKNSTFGVILSSSGQVGSQKMDPLIFLLRWHKMPWRQGLRPPERKRGSAFTDTNTTTTTKTTMSWPFAGLLTILRLHCE